MWMVVVVCVFYGLVANVSPWLESGRWRVGRSVGGMRLPAWGTMSGFRIALNS